MPYAYAVDDLAQVRICCYTPSQIGLNVMQIKCGAVTGGSVGSQEIANYLDTQLATLYKTLLSAQARYRGVGVRKILPLPITAEYSQIQNDGVGSVVGDLLPKQTSGLISLKTDFAGPKQRGRVYVPFPSEFDNQLDSTPSATYITALGSLGLKFVGVFTVTSTIPIGTADFYFVIWHRPILSTDQVRRYIARPRWATQRRRGDFGKPNVLPF